MKKKLALLSLALVTSSVFASPDTEFKKCIDDAVNRENVTDARACFIRYINFTSSGITVTKGITLNSFGDQNGYLVYNFVLDKFRYDLGNPKSEQQKQTIMASINSKKSMNMQAQTYCGMKSVRPLFDQGAIVRYYDNMQKLITQKIIPASECDHM
ncbi:TPA: hypothetical protein N2N45_004315 [Klebsiella aerogenes]|nr:hypothetical protein [Klebsiella aerogenes]